MEQISNFIQTNFIASAAMSNGFWFKENKGNSKYQIANCKYNYENRKEREIRTKILEKRKICVQYVL